jgi:hypothetical protein
VARRFKLWRDRYHYEVQRPESTRAEIQRRIDPATGMDVTAPGGFRALLQRHLEVTPEAPVWEPRSEVDMSGDVDWHLEPHFGVHWPQRFEEIIPDKIPGTDVVLLWHKNKMMPLLDLARQFEMTGDTRWSMAWYALVDSWCGQNPYRVGKNWRSPMEVGTRLVVWSHSLSMLRAAPAPDEEVCARLMRTVLRQGDHLAANFSLKDVPNNHLIGEAATLFVFASWWPLLADARSWMASAEETLEREVRRQILSDGFDYENSVNYHLYVLDFLLLYLGARALSPEAPPPSILDAAARVLDAALALVSPAGRFPQIGDDSMTDFLALRPCYPALETAPLAGSVAATDLVRPGAAATLRSRDWGAALMERSVSLECVRHFNDAGITVVRRPDSHLTLTSGPQHDHEFSPGHLNLDSGALELEVDGRALFVDSGTYLYTYDAGVRRHFRGASAHNTVVVDGMDPVGNTRTFGWDTVHRARVLAARAFDGGALAACERELPGAGRARFVHRRWLAEACGLWLVLDDVALDGDDADRRHEAEVWWHTTAVPAAVTLTDNNGFDIAAGDGGPAQLVVEVFSSGGHDIELRTDPDDFHTWYSRFYGDLQRGVTARTSLPVGEGCRVTHVIRRPMTEVRFDGWRRGGPALAVRSGGVTRTLELAPMDGSLAIDGRVVV